MRPVMRSILALALLVAGLSLAACTPAPPPQCRAVNANGDTLTLPHSAPLGLGLDCGGGTVTVGIVAGSTFEGLVAEPVTYPVTGPESFTTRTDWTLVDVTGSCDLDQYPDGTLYGECSGAASITLDLGDRAGFVGLSAHDGITVTEAVS
jgi:hypothetical protein